MRNKKVAYIYCSHFDSLNCIRTAQIFITIEQVDPAFELDHLNLHNWFATVNEEILSI